MSLVKPTTKRTPATKPPRSRRHAPDEARDIIVQRAIEFLSEHPFRDLTVVKLMGETELSRPAFYQYFDDLQGLAESLLTEIETAMRQTANPWIDGQGEPIAALRVALEGVVASCVAHGPIIRAVAEAAPMDARLEKAWSAFMKRWDESVATRIKKQQQAGLIDATLDARRTANALDAMNASVVIAEFGYRPQGSPSAVLDLLHQIWVKTLYGRAPTRLRTWQLCGASTTKKKTKSRR